MSESLMRRALLMLSHGILRATTDNAGIQTHQVQLNDHETVDGLPHLQMFGFASRPRVGSDSLVLFHGGDRSKGVVIGTNDRRAHPQLREGDVCLHDDRGCALTLGAGGVDVDAGGRPVRIRNAGSVTLIASGTVRIEADRLECTGEIVARCGGASVSLGTHTHPEHDNGDTRAPNPGT